MKHGKTAQTLSLNDTLSEGLQVGKNPSQVENRTISPLFVLPNWRNIRFHADKNHTYQRVGKTSKAKQLNRFGGVCFSGLLASLQAHLALLLV